MEELGLAEYLIYRVYVFRRHRSGRKLRFFGFSYHQSMRERDSENRGFRYYLHCAANACFMAPAHTHTLAGQLTILVRAFSFLGFRMIAA